MFIAYVSVLKDLKKGVKRPKHPWKTLPPSKTYENWLIDFRRSIRVDKIEFALIALQSLDENMVPET